VCVFVSASLVQEVSVGILRTRSRSVSFLYKLRVHSLKCSTTYSGFHALVISAIVETRARRRQERVEVKGLMLEGVREWREWREALAEEMAWDAEEVKEL